MIDLQKIKLMTHCAIYEENTGKKDLEMSDYFRSDYVRINIVKTIVFVTFGYLFLLVMYVLYNLYDLIENALKMDYKQIGITVLALYLSLLVVNIAISYIVFSAKYKLSRDRLNIYNKRLSMILRITERNELANEKQEKNVEKISNQSEKLENDDDMKIVEERSR